MLKLLIGVIVFYTYLMLIKILNYDEYFKKMSPPSVGKVIDQVMKFSGVDYLYFTFAPRFLEMDAVGRDKEILQAEKKLVEASENLRDLQIDKFKNEEMLGNEDFTIVVKDFEGMIQ
jgi:hypothetical protein